MQNTIPAIATTRSKRPYGRSLGDFRTQGKNTPHGLWPAEEKLLEAAMHGEACKIGESFREATDDNRVRGSFLRFLLLGGDEDVLVHEKGVELWGAFIDGDIDLESAPAVQPLKLASCRINGKLIGFYARFGQFNLQGSHIQSIGCSGVKIAGSVILAEGFTAEDEVNFFGAEIDGQFVCTRGTFKNASGECLICSSIKVTGGVFLKDSTAEGVVDFDGAEIGRQFVCNGGTFKNPGGECLSCANVQIAGNLVLAEGFSAEGEVNFFGAKIGGQFICTQGTFKNPGSKCLLCSSVKVTGGVFLSESFTAEGEVNFDGAEIGKQFVCNEGTFKNPDGECLTCSGAKIAGKVVLAEDFSAEGKVNFFGAEVNSFACVNSTFKNPGGGCLSCSSIKVVRGVVLSEGFSAEGEVNFIGAEIGGPFICSKGAFKNPGGECLSCSNVKVTGSVHLASGFTANGAVDFDGAEIGRNVVCNGGTFKHPNGECLSCSRAKIVGDVILTEGFTAEGEVGFHDAEIGGNFMCMGGSFRNFGVMERTSDDEQLMAGRALGLGGVKIHGTLCLGPAAAPNNHQVVLEGSLYLLGAYAKNVIDDMKSWPVATVKTEEQGILPCFIGLDGFTYDCFVGVAPTNAATRRKWLLRQSCDHLVKSFRPQPFEQLVKVLRAMGHEDDARQIAMFKQQLLQPQRVARAVWWHRPFVWLIGKFWGVFAGYGYRPHRLIVTLVALWLGCAAAYNLAAKNGNFVPADPQVWTSKISERCEPNWTACADIMNLIGFNALTYSADVLLPVIDLRQRATWVPRPGWMRALTWFENIAGSVCVLLLGAILGGLVKRD